MDKILTYMNVQEFLCNKELPSQADWDNYFAQHENTSKRQDDKGFLNYEEDDNYIFITDFISHGSGIKLFRQILGLSENTNKPILCNIHRTNTQLLNIAIKRYKFNLCGLYGNQYLLMKEVL